MENREVIAAVEERLARHWQEIVTARERGDWRRYWAERHAWIATGRYLAQLRLDDLQEQPEQLRLVSADTGRRHDAAS